MIATGTSDVQVPGGKGILGSGVLGINGDGDTGTGQEGGIHTDTSGIGGATGSWSAGVGKVADQGSSHINI